MLNDLYALAAPAAVQRATLLINHVLASEPAAAQRLQAHAGRCILLHFEGWPAVLPALPALGFRVTPAALVEWCGDTAPDEPELRIAIDASNPALGLIKALGGERPRVDVAGDAAFAADVSWLFDNLRWDVQDDLARVVGDAPARGIARLASAIATGARSAVRAVSGLGARARDAAAGQPPR